ncbi:hypothetical protein [Pantoea sp. 18069]|uniref:hypothetical protein n=1 Tax=Pantoea sp. 18069 TaxID=2681415 RepID=UPI00190F9EAB|nr:hypothetical protein [Pantoea sp. 18069]
MLGVHLADAFFLSVPVLAAARHLCTRCGLGVRDEGDALALYTHGHPHRWGRVFQTAGPRRLAWLSLGSHCFRYVPDPWGRYAQDSCDFDFGGQCLALDRPPRRGLALCPGASAPQDFIVHHETAA